MMMMMMMAAETHRDNITMVLFYLFLLVITCNCEIFTITDESGQQHKVQVDVNDSSALSVVMQACRDIFLPDLPSVSVCERSFRCGLLLGDPSHQEVCHENYDPAAPNDLMAATFAQDIVKPRYPFSTHTCQGGSQVIDSATIHKNNYRGHFNDTAAGDFRICKFHNVCLVHGEHPTMVYFQDPDVFTEGLPPEFLLSYFSAHDHLQLGFISHYQTRRFNKSFMPILFLNQSIPPHENFHSDHRVVGFLEAHSWPNYGHILLDNVFATFAAALQFNIPVHKVQPVFETNCARFGFRHPTDPSDVHPELTKREECRRYLSTFGDGLIFDNSNVYLDNNQFAGTKLCFRTLIAGHSSALGQQAWDLSRGSSLRAFRDHVVGRFQQLGLIRMVNYDDRSVQSEPDNLIVVLLRGGGDAMTVEESETLNARLCPLVAEFTEMYQRKRGVEYRVECVYPHSLTLAEEIELAQRARVVVSYHGTVAYSILFARDDTQVVLLTDTVIKDFHIFSRATHFHVLWLTLNRLHELAAVLSHAVRLLNA
jgi:hypothetical protein